MIDKMPQLDRIELRQRHYELENSYADKLINTTTAINYSIFLFAVIFIADIWSALHGQGWFNSETYGSVIMILGLYIVISAGLDLFNLFVYSKKNKELYSDYFKEEVKLKRKK